MLYMEPFYITIRLQLTGAQQSPNLNLITIFK